MPKKVAKKAVAKKAAPKHPSFRFVGDPNSGTNPTEIEFRGFVFELNGKAVEVSDPEIASKLAANSHFS